jgi:FAD/FMN-containing dehydrogenase
VYSPINIGQARSHQATAYFPRGLGRSYGDASLPATGVPVLETRFLDRYIRFEKDSGLLEAEAGVSLGTLLDLIVPSGFFLPVTPGTKHVTLGGAVAANVHGKNHHHAGSIENFITSLEIDSPSGRFTCGPGDNSGLFGATVGGYGLTGLISKVTLKLKKVASPRIRAVALKRPALRELFAAFRENDERHEYSVAWVDALASGPSLGRGVLFLGDHEGAGKTDPGAQGEKFRIPRPIPDGLLHPVLLRIFNALYYRLPRSSAGHPGDYDGFFYPLDRIGNWNFLYGPKGFFQYQAVFPDPAGETGTEEALRFLARHRLGSFLCVLKRCGDDHAALPFCKRGYTLALDIPNRGDETLRLLDELDRIVIEHGGRVYLAKDARLSPESFRAMYPGWQFWMQTVKRYNPGHCRSRLSERLKLWDA